MTNTTSKRVILDQAVHGYSDGHRLLAVSRKLTKESLRTMLVLSDMSGPSMISGFEEYVTGYPLPDDNLFALAKTWYAPEMERAGCVWTHTLLLDPRDVPHNIGPDRVSGLFQKPSGQESVSKFSERLEIASDRVAAASILAEDWTARAVVSSLYGSDHPVVIIADTAAEHEALLLALWAQQWPLACREFRFCTGSIRFRESGGVPFDIQVIPPPALRETRRRFPHSTIVDAKTPDEIATRKNWFSLVFNDLVVKVDDAFRQFLRWADVKDLPSRTALQPLARVFSMVQEAKKRQVDFNDLVAAVAAEFPVSSSATRLKTGLFGTLSQRQWLRGVEEFAIVRALATTTYHEAFDADALRLYERSVVLWRSDDVRFREGILQHCKILSNPLQEAVASAVITSLSDEQLCPMLQEFPALLSPVECSTALGNRRAAWRCSPETQFRLIAAIQEAASTREVGRAIVAAQLDAQSDVVADKTVSWLGIEAVEAVFAWVESKESTAGWSLPRKWQQILGEQPLRVMEWIEQHRQTPIASLISVIYLLDPNCRAVRDASGELWMHLADRTANELHGRDATDGMAFLLVVSLSTKQSFGPSLAGRAFPTVYAAAAADTISSKALAVLQSQFSGIGWQWDKCRRLRRGLVEAFAEKAWATSAFLECTRDPGMLSAIYDMWGWGHKEVQYLRQVMRDATQDNGNATQGQLHVLLQYRKWFS